MTNSPHKYIRIKNKIKDSIKNGSIADKLPGERVLAAELGASYMTVRKAVADLVEEGILHRASTKGTFVSNKSRNNKITHNIGFFLDEEIKEGISSPYYSFLFKSLEEELTRRDYNILFFSDFDDLDPLKNNKKIDGVIISCFPRIEDRIQTIKKYLPIVLLDNHAADKSIPSVTIDNFNSSRNAVEYLFTLGHRRIGFISGLMDSDICKDRLQGYQSALTGFGIKAERELVFKGDYSFESGERGGKYFVALKNPPTAIVCANDSMAIGAMKVIRESGLKIPDDISIIGFDDILVASMVFPPLTTNAAPVETMAARAVEILLAEIKGDYAGFQHIILEAPLVIRDSCTAAKS